VQEICRAHPDRNSHRRNQPGQLANGFFNTFLSLRLTTEGFGATATGIVLSAYFVGFTIGAVGCGGGNW
jgi:hypothetical protein